MSGLQHLEYAKRELEMIDTDPAVCDAYLQVVAAFTAIEKQGVPASSALAVVKCLLQLKPLSPLTDDPNEWHLVSRGLWQSFRDAEAFSRDGGKTYTLISEVQETRKAPKHQSSHYSRKGE